MDANTTSVLISLLTLGSLLIKSYYDNEAQKRAGKDRERNASNVMSGLAENTRITEKIAQKQE